MTTITGVLEGYYDSNEKFKKFFHGREYAGGKAKARVRTFEPISITVNDIGKKELLADLKSLSRFEDFDLKLSEKRGEVGVKDSGKATKNQLRRLFKWARAWFRSVKNIDSEFKNVPDSQLRSIEAKKGNHFLCDFHVFGEVKDVYVNGEEVV